MKTFLSRFRNAIKPCAGVVHVPRLKLAAQPHEPHWRRHASASAALVSRGSIAMSRFPMVSEDEIDARREKMLRYDFKSFK